MKKTIVLLIMIAACSMATAQDPVKFWTKSMSYKHKDSYGNWTKWSAWQSVRVLVLVKGERITIHSSERQEYDIIKTKNEYVDSDGDTVYSFTAIDQDGDQCTIRLIARKSGDPQMYIDFANIMWVYNLEISN